MGVKVSSILIKWVGFVAAIWVQAIAGNNYGFSNYSVALKAVGSYNQLELNNLGVAKDVGKALGLAAGFAADVLPPWAILLIGSVEGLVGYGIQWLILDYRMPPLPYWQMCVVLCLGGNSTTWMNTAVLVTCVRNFRRSRGPVVGILKGYIGLSTAIFTVLCSSLFSGNATTFVLLLAVVPFAVCIIAMVFLRPVPPAESQQELEEDRRSLFMLNAIATVLALYLLAYDFSEPHLGDVAIKVSAVLLLLLLALPIYVPAKLLLLHCLKPVHGSTFSEDGIVLDVSDTQPLLDTDKASASLNNEIEHIEVDDLCPAVMQPQQPKLGDDHNLMQAGGKWEFGLLFFSLLCGMGTGMVLINNLGQIGQTLGYNDVSTFVSLTSVWGFFGRIGSGLVSEHYVRSVGLPRPVWLAASQLLMIVGYAVLAVAGTGSLYIGSSIVGLCYGVRLAVTVPTASELFGLKYFGLIYNVLIINIPLGSFIFSGLLAGYLYDYEAEKMTGPNAQNCTGIHCFRLTFIIMIAVCVVGFISDVILCLATKTLYKSFSKSSTSSSQ